MHTRAAVAVFDAGARNKIVTGKMTSDRSMSRPFPTGETALINDARNGSLISHTRTLPPPRAPADGRADARNIAALSVQPVAVAAAPVPYAQATSIQRRK